jgi:hypothetical protein
LKRWGFVKALKTNKNLGKFSIIWIELLKILGMNRRFFMMAMQLAELWFMVTIAIDGAIGYQK